MNKTIEKIAHKFSEGYLSSNPTGAKNRANLYHRKVTVYKSSDISFINGLVATGFRGLAHLSATELTANYNQILTAARQHLPVVISVDAYNAHSNALLPVDCFQLVATSLQEHVYMLLVAQKIAELSLVPGVVIAGYHDDDQAISIPSDELIKKYLGSPDDQILCTTPAQKILFGQSRRRCPKWFSADLPVMLGAEKDGLAAAFEAMGSRQYFFQHLPEIILEAVQLFKKVFAVDLELIKTYGNHSETLLISSSAAVISAYSSLPDKNKPQLLLVKQLKPFPELAIKLQLEKRKAIAIIENVAFGGSSSPTFMQIERLEGEKTILHSIGIGPEFTPEHLDSALKYLQQNPSKKDILAEIAFTKTSSRYPKHEILLQELNKHYPDLSNKTVYSHNNSGGQKSNSIHIPAALQKHHDKGPNYTKLARFFDDTAYFYQQKETTELVADPFAALPITPGETAGFFTAKNDHNRFPVLKPAKCTGCGACFVHCPHAALPPLLIGVEQLLKAGMELAVAKGNLITKLTPLLRNTAKLSGQFIKGKKIKRPADFLPEAFESLIAQMQLEDAAAVTARQEFEFVLTEINALPVAVTEHFFTKPDGLEKGTGELFSLAVNPDACTGCGICADSCDDRALRMDTITPDLLVEKKAVYALWEKLPDTNPATLKSLEESGTYSPFARILLSRENYFTMSGASSSELHNPYKTLVHLILATTNAITKPAIQAQVNRLDELIDSLSEGIHKSLSKALPKENLDALGETLRETGTDKTSFHELVDKIEAHEHLKLINTKALRRQTDLVEGLKNLKWVLKEGPTGIGRANYGLLVAGNAPLSWARSYPNNNFGCPVLIHWQGSAPDQMLGVVHGHVRHAIDNIKLIQRAELEAVNKYDPSVHDLEIASLDYAKLSPAEQALVPPILLLAERDDLGNTGWQSMARLLCQELPVKIVILDHIAPPNHDPVADFLQSSAGIIAAIALKKAFVFQGSIANEVHLANGLIDGLSHTNPALFNLYAYHKDYHISDDDMGTAFAALAAESRSFPFLRFNPDEEHGFLNGVIDLDANREFMADWVEESVSLPGEQSITYKITWADWAFTQPAWKDEFKKTSPDDANTMLADYLNLSKKDRAKKIPVIIRGSQVGYVYYAVSRTVLQMTETVLANWKTLQELAGLITEFPARLSEEVKKELTKKFEADAKEFKKQNDAELKRRQQEHIEQVRVQIKERLIALAKMAKN